MVDDEYWHPDGDTLKAMAGDRKANINMLERVAQGVFDEDVKMWLAHLAGGVLDAESKDAGRLRDAAIVRALGLQGTADKNRELRELCENLADFGYSRKEIFKTVRTGLRPSGFFSCDGYDHTKYADLDEIVLLKLIDTELSKRKKERSPKN